MMQQNRAAQVFLLFVRLYFDEKSQNQARFDARTRTAFWDPFQLKMRRQKSSLSVYFFGPMSKIASTL